MDSQNRLLIAVALSVLILVVYQKLFVAPHIQKAQPKAAEETVRNRIITVSSTEKTIASREEKRAKTEEIALVPGISKTLAKEIVNHFNKD